jgi:hypothetical protein
MLGILMCSFFRYTQASSVGSLPVDRVAIRPNDCRIGVCSNWPSNHIHLCSAKFAALEKMNR